MYIINVYLIVREHIINDILYVVELRIRQNTNTIFSLIPHVIYIYYNLQEIVVLIEDRKYNRR